MTPLKRKKREEEATPTHTPAPSPPTYKTRRAPPPIPHGPHTPSAQPVLLPIILRKHVLEALWPEPALRAVRPAVAAVLRPVQPVHPDAGQRARQDRRLRRAQQPGVDDQHGEEGERDGPAKVVEAAVSSRWRDGVGVAQVGVGRALLYDPRDSVRRRDGHEAEVKGGKSGHAVLFWWLRAHAPPTVPFRFSVRELGLRVRCRR